MQIKKKRAASIASALNRSNDNRLKNIVLQARSKNQLLDSIKWILPPEIQPFCVGARANGPILTITVTEPSLLTRLHYYQRDLLREIQKTPDFAQFKQLKFKLTYGKPPNKLQIDKRELQQPRQFSQSSLDMLSNWQTNTDQNSELYQSLQKILNRHKNKK